MQRSCSRLPGDDGRPGRRRAARPLHGKEAVRPRSGRLQGSAPPKAGIKPQDPAPAGSCWRTRKRKCTESVSPSSSSPDRPSPKRLPGGSAFNLRRSVLGAIGKIAPDFACVKHIRMRFCRKLRQSAFQREIIVVERSCDTHSTTKMHRARCSLVRLSTDRRRSDCLSESHQPRALRPRCTRDTRASRRWPSSIVQIRNSALCGLFFTPRTHLRSTLCALQRTGPRIRRAGCAFVHFPD